MGYGRPLPTTFEFIERVALAHPHKLAVVEGRHGWTYEAVFAQLVRLSRALDQLGVRRGQRVAVSRPGFCLQLLLLIACENLGAVPAPFHAEGDPDAQALFGLCDRVLSEKPQDVPAGKLFHLMDEAWLRQVAAIDPDDGRPCPRVVTAMDEPQRLSRTSGSTGRSRFMLLTRELQDNWIRGVAVTNAYGPDTRLLVGGPLVINSAYSRSCGCLRLGATVLSLEGGQLEGIAITHIWSLPMHLERLLSQLPPGFARRDHVVVGTVGGFMPPGLRQRTLQFFGGGIINRYGTNEVGNVCDNLDASGTGLLGPGVELRIVDEDGRELPPGEIGRIAVRTSVMVDGYLDDPEATKAAFRDGWFHSGDWGALVGPRLLRLAGRHDDLMNVGGIKVPAAQLADRIRELLQLEDCAVMAVNLHGGATTVGVAVVTKPGAPPPDLAALQDALPLGASTEAQVLQLKELPRLQGGKLDRRALHRLFAATA
jgi:acyl-coenzyme A synthetase/AMP-(fatty) acid ligase